VKESREDKIRTWPRWIRFGVGVLGKGKKSSFSVARYKEDAIYQLLLLMIAFCCRIPSYSGGAARVLEENRR